MFGSPRARPIALKRRCIHWLAGAIVVCIFLLNPVSHEAVAAQRWSQLADTVFKHLTAEQGLPHPVVTAVVEDRNGFLWVGTQGGLARWDGYRFRVYRSEPQNSGTLADNFIHALHIDRKGRLWIGTASGGLMRYVPEEDRFIRIPVGATGVSHVSVNAIIDDDVNDGIWIGTEGGLDYLNLTTDTIGHVRSEPTDSRSLPDNRIRALLRDRNGTLWVGTAKGVVRRNGSRGGNSGFIAVPLPIPPGQLPVIWSLMQTEDSKIWVGTRQFGLFVVDPRMDTVQALQENDPTGMSLANEFVTTMVEIKTGEVWVGTYGQGIVTVDTTSLETRRIRHDASVPTSLANDLVFAMRRDRSGLLWIGTARGLSYRDPSQTAVLTLFGDATRPAGLTDIDIASVMPARDGNIWLGLGNNGIDIIAPGAARVAGIRPHPRTTGKTAETADATSDVFEKAHVVAISEADGATFVGTDRGLYRTDANGKKMVRLASASKSVGGVRVLLRDGDRMWIGGGFDGLWVLDLAAGDTAQPTRPLTDNLLTDQRLMVMEKAPGGSLWIGTRNGLNLFNPDTMAVEKIMPNAADRQSLSAGMISSLLTDRQQRLWVGTFGGGISILTGRDENGKPRFRHLSMKDGLPDVNIGQLLEDASGNIWASTSAGLATIDLKTLTVRSLGRADGVAIPGYWSHSGAVTRQGELLFGGAGGLTVIQPGLFKEWAYRPLVVITDIRLGGKSIPAYPFNVAKNDESKPLTIKADANNVAVEFAALDYSAPENNRYAYRLEGVDKAWIDTDPTRRLAAYSNLSPGMYRLHLRGSNRNGVWSEDALVLPIRVLPAWYQTWWMRTIEALAAIAAIFGVVQGRTQYLRQRRSELQSQVSLRTSELQQKQTQLVVANKELETSAETLRQLGDVGRDITASLDAVSVFNALHRHIGGLLDAAAMTIHRMNAAGTLLEPVFAREDGHTLQQLENISMDSTTSNIARVARERREVLIERQPDAISPSHVANTRHMLTSLFAPLIVDERLLGVMSIQSDRPRAYGNRERLIFKTLCAYGAIALDNAHTYRQLEATLKTLKLTQRELLGKNQELAHANALQEEHRSELTRFLAVASHDLRQPMHALNLYLGALTNFDMPDAARPVLGNVRQCAQILDDMFLALLDLSRLDAQVVDPFIERFPIASLLSSIAIAFAPQARAKGLQLRVVHCSAWIETDAALVEQILSNLIANAIRYTESGTILIGCRRRGNQLRLAVFDTGIGISADQQKSVFDEFSQLGNPGHDRTKGLGLGLAIVRRLGRLLSAPISLVSIPGKGSMFAIDLPRIEATALGSENKHFHAVTPTAAGAEGQVRLADKLIVVIDDEESILGAMRVLLEQWGCVVVTAMSGIDAISKLGNSMRVPDALICDYRLDSAENGVDAILAIQSEFNLDIPSLVVTGTISVEGIQELTSAGMPTLHKPVNAAHLHDALLKILTVTQA